MFDVRMRVDHTRDAYPTLSAVVVATESRGEWSTVELSVPTFVLSWS